MTDSGSGLSRRDFLVGGGIAVAAVVAGAGLTAAGIDAWNSRLLTATALAPLAGQRVSVSVEGQTSSAVVQPLDGINGRVAERSYVLTLHSATTLPPGGGTVTLEHPDLGRHDLFMNPTRDPRQWVAVVNQLQQAGR